MNVLVLPDLHAPFHHPGALDFLARLRREYKPRVVVCIGDLGDQHGWSRHDRHPDALGQGEEDAACLSFCRSLYKLFPRALACVGNHDERLAKRCAQAGVPTRLHRSVAEVYGSPAGWKWDAWHRHEGVVYAHGDGFSGRDAAIKAATAYRAPAVIGHVHSAGGALHSAGPHNTVWGLSVGCLIDVDSVAFSYAAKATGRPVLGAGVVVDGVPRFEPYRC